MCKAVPEDISSVVISSFSPVIDHSHSNSDLRISTSSKDVNGSEVPCIRSFELRSISGMICGNGGQEVQKERQYCPMQLQHESDEPETDWSIDQKQAGELMKEFWRKFLAGLQNGEACNRE
jgi:hypothetical protein